MIPKEFMDSYGFRFQLIPEIRSVLKPGWETMFDPFDSKENISNEEKANHKIFASSVATVCKAFNWDASHLRILELGCSYGYSTYLLAQEGFTVLGIDTPEYSIDQTAGLSDCAADRDKICRWFAKKRALVASEFPEEVANRVKFYDLDAQKMEYENEFDMIVSCDTLEHIIDYKKMFRLMNTALKKNGIMVHFYNPFFSIDGGHSLCTLDFLWGHCILSEHDFDRYIKRLRPKEHDVAIKFYKNCLNRMSLSDLTNELRKNKFTLNAINKKCTFDRFDKLAKDRILPFIARNYTNVGFSDMMNNSVNFVATKQ